MKNKYLIVIILLIISVLINIPRVYADNYSITSYNDLVNSMNNDDEEKNIFLGEDISCNKRKWYDY